MRRHRPARAARHRVGRVAAAAAALALAAGCTGGPAVSTDSGQDRFVSGDGVVTVVPVGERVPGPALSGEDLDGKPLTVEPAGKGPLVVNVWGSWCAPCKEEQPLLERLAAETRARGVRFVGINIRDGSPTAARQHVARYGVTYPSFYDPAGRLLTRFEVPARAIPTTYVIAADGRIAAYVYGAIEEDGLRTVLDRVGAS
jgi:thiol-disulfide isomerase/thioredoxin